MGSGFPIDATLGQEESLKCSGTRVRMRVGILSVSEASLDFRKRQFHHTRILSRVPKLHFKGSCSPACSLLPKSIWICSEFVVYARAVCQRSFRHEPKMEGEGGEVSQSFVWNRCRETVPPCRVRKGAFCFVKCFSFRVLKVFTEELQKLKWFLCFLGNNTSRNT
jgi:hypothetical protein